MITQAIALLFLLYAGLGVGAAVLLIIFGATRILPAPAPITWPARLLLIPGAIAFWPMLLTRWLRTRHPEVS